MFVNRVMTDFYIPPYDKFDIAPILCGFVRKEVIFMKDIQFLLIVVGAIELALKIIEYFR